MQNTTNPQVAPPAEALRRLAESVTHLVRDFGRLVVLETKLAANSLVMIAALAAGAALLGITAWFLLVLALVQWLADNWLSGAAAALAVAVVLAIIIAPLVLMMRKYAGNLSFPATRRQLGNSDHGNRRPEDLDRAG